MKKIVILALHLSVGGIERVITNVSNLLCENNDVTIISTYKINENPSFEIDDRINIEYLLEDLKPNRKELKDAIKNLNIIEIIKQSFISAKVLYLRKKLMIKAIKKIDADIVISTRAMHNKWLGKYAKKGIIKIAQEHNHHNNNKKYIKKVIRSLKNIDFFMPPSNELSKFYEKLLKNKKTKVIYIPNLIENDSKEISELKEKVILSVGRLERIKGFLDLIEVFKIVNQTYPDWKLKIAGSGSQEEELQQKIYHEKLEKNIELVRRKNKRRIKKIVFRIFCLCYDIIFRIIYVKIILLKNFSVASRIDAYVIFVS